MKSLRYLNLVLTVIALLLSLNLYVQFADGPAGDMLSPATKAYAGEARGIGSQGERQQVMIEELKSMNAKLDRIDSTLNNKTIKVQQQGLGNAE